MGLPLVVGTQGHLTKRAFIGLDWREKVRLRISGTTRKRPMYTCAATVWRISPVYWNTGVCVCVCVCVRVLHGASSTHLHVVEYCVWQTMTSMARQTNLNQRTCRTSSQHHPHSEQSLAPLATATTLLYHVVVHSWRQGHCNVNACQNFLKSPPCTSCSGFEGWGALPHKYIQQCTLEDAGTSS